MGTIADTCCNSSKKEYNTFPSLGSLDPKKGKLRPLEPTMSSV